MSKKFCDILISNNFLILPFQFFKECRLKICIAEIWGGVKSDLIGPEYGPKLRILYTARNFLVPEKWIFCPVTLYLLRTLVRFQVLTAASVKLTVLWDMAPSSLIEADRRFRSAYCLHHQHRFTCKRLHGDISQKAVVFILATSIHIFVRPHYCYMWTYMRLVFCWDWALWGNTRHVCGHGRGMMRCEATLPVQLGRAVASG
jgi:hypothetical protein